MGASERRVEAPQAVVGRCRGRGRVEGLVPQLSAARRAWPARRRRAFACLTRRAREGLRSRAPRGPSREHPLRVAWRFGKRRARRSKFRLQCTSMKSYGAAAEEAAPCTSGPDPSCAQRDGRRLVDVGRRLPLLHRSAPPLVFLCAAQRGLGASRRLLPRFFGLPGAGRGSLR
jgi:hypothetical protein